MQLKEQIHRYCLELVSQRVSEAQSAMHAAQQAANSETKSSAGDKYETGRAMAHLDKERHTRRHAAALTDLTWLQQLDPKTVLTDIEEGALVETSLGYYYIAVGLGEVIVENGTYFVISPSSPIGECLLELEVGDVTDFRGRTLEVLAVY